MGASVVGPRFADWQTAVSTCKHYAFIAPHSIDGWLAARNDSMNSIEGRIGTLEEFMAAWPKQFRLGGLGLASKA